MSNLKIEERFTVDASVAQVWRTAEWHEREVYDLIGVEFTGHTDMRTKKVPVVFF